MNSIIKFLFSITIVLSVLNFANESTLIDPLTPSEFNKLAIYIKDQRVYKPFVIETGTIEEGLVYTNGTDQYDVSFYLMVFPAICMISSLFKRKNSTKSISSTSQQVDIQPPSSSTTTNVEAISSDEDSSILNMEYGQDQQFEPNQYQQDQLQLIIMMAIPYIINNNNKSKKKQHQHHHKYKYKYNNKNNNKINKNNNNKLINNRYL